MAKLPRFYLDFDEGIELDNILMERNSIVKEPAHGRQAVFFRDQKKPIKFDFDKEKGIVIGVAIEANKPIFRRANEQFNADHEVVFTPQAIEKIRDSFHKSTNIHRLNEDHESDDKEVILIQSYIVGGKENPSLPEVFKNQDIKDGSWIVGYKILSEELKDKVRNGDFSGFSVEVYLDYSTSKKFGKVPNVKISKYKQNRMTMKKKKAFWSDFFKKASKFEAIKGELTGNEYTYEGDLEIGTILMVAGEAGEEGEEAGAVVAANIEDTLIIDGKEVAIATGDDGAITAIVDVEEEPTITDEVLAEFANAVRSEITSLRSEIKRLDAKFEAIGKEDKSASKKKPSKYSGGKSAIDLLNPKK